MVFEKIPDVNFPDNFIKSLERLKVEYITAKTQATLKLTRLIHTFFHIYIFHIFSVRESLIMKHVLHFVYTEKRRKSKIRNFGGKNKGSYRCP